MAKRKFPVPEELNTAKEVQIRGIIVRGALSPFDFPISAEANLDEEKNEFVLRFQYPGPPEEEVKYPNNDKKVVLYTGKKSGRLFTVIVRGVEDRTQIPNIAIQAIFRIQKKVEQAQSDYPYMEWLNYAAAMEFLKTQREQLMA